MVNRSLSKNGTWMALSDTLLTVNNSILTVDTGLFHLLLA